MKPAEAECLIPGVVTTARMVLRRPRTSDADQYAEWHGDPDLYRHAPWARLVDRRAADVEFARQLAMWREQGFGYWIATDRDSGDALGICGLRPADQGRLNLYYRFGTAAQGRGLAREATRAAVATAMEWLPEAPVEAIIIPQNAASIAVATRSGLDLVGSRRYESDPEDVGESLVFRAPMVARHERLTDPEREALLGLWMRVNDAGGSVGFLPGAPRERVAAALSAHEKQMAAGDAAGVSLTAADGTLIGWAWWVRSPNPLVRHGAWLWRFMIDPARQGLGLGSALLSGCIGEARRDGLDLMQLAYRSGTGLGRFYARSGFVEVGRIPQAIRVGPGDERDDVTMARRVDGRALQADGRE